MSLSPRLPPRLPANMSPFLRWQFEIRVAISALLAIVGSGARDASLWLHFTFKPLTTLLIFLSVLQVKAPVNARYRSAILFGIACSFAGDVFLMLPVDVLAQGFVFGLASFLVAHLFFLRAFCSDTKLFGHLPTLIFVFLVGAANLSVLWPGLTNDLKIPVVAYMLCLIGMTAQTLIRHRALGTQDSRFAALGGILFLASDTILAYNKFYAPIPASGLLVLGSYYAALVFIAKSVSREGVYIDGAANDPILPKN